MSTTQPTQESQGLHTAQSTPELEGLRTLCSIDTKSLTPEHQAHTEGEIERGAVVVAQLPLPQLTKISPAHLAEWVEGSGVPEAIVRLAVQSLNDRTVIAQRINWKKYLDKHALGWWVSSIDLSTMQLSDVGQFKPDEPVMMSPEDEDGSKYLTRKDKPYDAIALPHPDKDFWPRVIDDPSHPVELIEGPKKAGCLVGLDYAALALCGVTMGLQKGGKNLVKNLEILAVEGRPIRIVFDADLATNPDIRRALKALATVLKKKGCVVSVVIIPVELESKGMDDVWANHGPEKVKEIMDNAVPYSAWLKSLEARVQATQSSDRKKANGSKTKGKGKKKEKDFGIKWGENTLAKEIAEKYRVKLAWHIQAQKWMRYEANNEGIWGEEPEEIVKSVVIAELDQIAGHKAVAQRQAQIAEAIAADQIDIAEALEAEPLEVRSYTHGFVSGVMKFLQSFLAAKRWDEETPGLIPLKNGVYNYLTGDFSKHSPGHHLTWTLPYDYIPLATCQPITDWLLSATGDKQTARLLIAFLRSIVTGRTDIHRFLELVGPGGSGKSTATRLAQALTGTENTHTTTLAKLEGSRFETACLWNKRLAVINDSERYAGNVTVLKAMTGSDTIPNEAKFVQSTQGFVFPGKVILTCNEIVQSADYTSGLERRRITIPFKNRIPVGQQKNLIEIKGDRVTGEFAAYLPGLFNLVMQMSDKEMEWLLKDTEESVPILNQQKSETLLDINPIADWLNYCVVHDPTTRVQVGLALPDKDHDSQTSYLNINTWLYASYCEYSKNSGSRSVAVRRFVNLLDDLVINQIKLDGVAREKGSSGRSYFRGLRIRRDGDDDDIPSPVTGKIINESVRDSQDTVRDTMRDETVGNQESQGSEGKIEKSENIFNDFSNLAEKNLADEKISNFCSEKVEKGDVALEFLSDKDLTPHAIPHTIPQLPSQKPTESVTSPEPETAPALPTVPPITPSTGSSQSNLLLLQDYARRIGEALGYQSPATAKAIAEYIQESIVNQEITESELAEVAGIRNWQAFTALRNLTEDEQNLVEIVQQAIASNDAETAKSALSSLKEVCNSGAADRQKVWNSLAESERIAFKALVQ
ncbi:DUF3854 domain-containing protein [Microcoleus sp. MON2_D5]|uniref:DUF3854 domain-containing protein n=1 Tax=Microcoleus sp. MON2_D5 TaxID=2818833 RepID=UPI002FD25FFD